MTYAAGLPTGDKIFFGGDIVAALNCIRKHNPPFDFRLVALASPADLLWYEQDKANAAQS